MALVLDELLEDAPVTWFLSYNGAPLLPPMRVMELIMDFPQEMPALKQRKTRLDKPQHCLSMPNRNQIPSFANPCNDNGCHTLGRVLHVKTLGLQGTTLFVKKTSHPRTTYCLTAALNSSQPTTNC